MSNDKPKDINVLIYENLDLMGYEVEYPNDFTICLKKGGKTLIVAKEEILSEISYSTGYIDYKLKKFIESEGNTYHT